MVSNILQNYYIKQQPDQTNTNNKTEKNDN